MSIRFRSPSSRLCRVVTFRADDMGLPIAAILMGLSAGMQYVQQRRQGKYEARQQDINASMADRQAADAIARGAEAAGRVKRDTKQLIGSQRVALAGQGIDIDTGTAGDLQDDAAHLGELDRLQVLHNAQREAFGFQVDAANSRAGAETTRTATRNAGRTTLLTAASQLYARKTRRT